ncbi:MAG: AarF/UbiB family protein [Acidobacteriota bacterium]|nr:AarF/UbiB family protein [Blastocatellia bacterium]MDW8411857.1 AarF/UbiB family protein [Acidobacteriota bacterium]
MQRSRKLLELTPQEYADRAASVFMQMLSLVPEDRQDALMALMLDERRLSEPEAVREELLALLSDLDIEANREQIVSLLLELIPVQELVPKAYEKYIQMVADAAKVILSKLSAKRLLSKVVDQMLLPLEATLQERLLKLITRMPTMQKLGQIIARNKHLDPELRSRLQKLENSIRDASYESILARINDELKHKLSVYKVKLGRKFLAEASVCAVVPFTWRSPNDGVKRKGVFKVLKPFITDYWNEDLKILDALAEHFDRNKKRYGLPTVGFRQILREVRELFKREVKLPIEQNRLQEAREFYSQETNIRVPNLLPMTTKVVTGMEFIDGLKVTVAAERFPEKRNRIAQLILDKTILSVLFHTGEEALFHADPHAGNIFYCEKTDELALLDWGLSCKLSRPYRRQLIQLILGFVIRDYSRAIEATCSLTDGRIAPHQIAIVERRVKETIDKLPLFPLVRLAPLTQLLDDLILDGLRFPAELLMFRKSLFTLLGVIHDVSAEFDVDWHVTNALLSQMLKEMPLRLTRSPWSTDYPTQISTFELKDVFSALVAIAAQLGMQQGKMFAALGIDRALGKVLSVLRPATAD